MQTAEGKIKAKVRKYLRGLNVYVFSPVQMGMGMPTLDDLCCIRGRFVGIEYKQEGKYPTPRQLHTMSEIRRAGGLAIWGDSFESIQEQLKRVFGLTE